MSNFVHCTVFPLVKKEFWNKRNYLHSGIMWKKWKSMLNYRSMIRKVKWVSESLGGELFFLAKRCVIWQGLSKCGYSMTCIPFPSFSCIHYILSLASYIFIRPLISDYICPIHVLCISSNYYLYEHVLELCLESIWI